MKLIVAYYIGIFFFGVVCLVPWIVRDSTYGAVLDRDAVNRPWWAFFTTASMYANVGIHLQ